MKIGFIFECGPEGPDVQVCRHLVHKLDPSIEFVPSTLDNKKNLVEDCGAVAKALLDECEKVIVVWDLYPAWREKGMKPCRHEDRQAIFQSLRAENVDLDKIFLVCIREELEAWLLADNRAVTAMLQLLKQPHSVSRISKFSTPDSIRNPKKRLTRIFTQELGPRRRYVDYLHALLIAREIADFSRIRRSDSFKRFALKVAGMQL
ncbi:MAG: DUF4276 family protein [Desulfobacterales bacterium]|uniref:DUF4276 family protein n=1 Tax=Candidatus Desulfatibia profunda TaxID=2841695 RepID=A0A8J6TNX8_9BACT|nr:DUF4276 family protein [Candidatus Desulfatibia profunda]MBL7179874.1 DUF4276 family protein [Desulfobacterales bacterium]